MPDFSLRIDGETARLPNRTLLIRVQGANEPVALEARRVSTGELVVASLPGQPKDTLYVNNVDEKGVLVSACPLAGGVFRPGAHVCLEVSTSGDRDPSRVTLLGTQGLGVDVGGLSEAEVASLFAEDGAILVVMRTGGTPLPPLADAALVLAARMLGLSGKASRGDRDIALTVDGSASMRPWCVTSIQADVSPNPSTVEALVNVVVGVDRALGRDSALDVRVAAGSGASWTVLPAAEAGGKVAELIGGSRAQTGADLWLEPVEQGRAWLVLTDEVPSRIPPRVTRVLIMQQALGTEPPPPPTDPRVETVTALPQASIVSQLDASPGRNSLLTELVRSIIAACQSTNEEGVLS